MDQGGGKKGKLNLRKETNDRKKRHRGARQIWAKKRMTNPVGGGQGGPRAPNWKKSSERDGVHRKDRSTER